VRTLNRNKQELWYSLMTGSEEVADDNGLLTGETRITYSDPVKTRMSMSISSGANNLGSQGMVVLDPFGITTAYTHRLVTEDLDCPINEESLLWIGKTPADGAHNFKVVRVARSLNHVIYYAKECDVSEQAD
jgi:hypothetical protein